MPKTSAKVPKSKERHREAKYPLDKVLEKRRLGRPEMIKASRVRGRADDFRTILTQIGDRVFPGLLKAQTREEILLSFEGTDIGAYALEFARLADLIFKVRQERKFPKQNRKAQINFLADSIAGYGMVAPRTARDICE